MAMARAARRASNDKRGDDRCDIASGPLASGSWHLGCSQWRAEGEPGAI